jgi:hypothetical protein
MRKYPLGNLGQASERRQDLTTHQCDEGVVGEQRGEGARSINGRALCVHRLTPFFLCDSSHLRCLACPCLAEYARQFAIAFIVFRFVALQLIDHAVAASPQIRASARGPLN